MHSSSDSQQKKWVRVTTGSRLHFGLLNLASTGVRRFGGVGLMVAQPGLRVEAQPAATWHAEGLLTDRALAFGQRFVGADGPAFHLRIRGDVREHSGLGSGTQLGMAVATALARLMHLELGLTDLARRVGRGLRSAIGVHGFANGGFLVDAGQATPGAIAPLVAHANFPGDWRVIIAHAGTGMGMHGRAEAHAIDQLALPGAADAMCRLVLLGLLPALVERDLAAFGAALFEFNARAGEVFASVQGGVYASREIADLIAWFRAAGVAGVGQSSWGPTVFAVVGSEEHATELRRRLFRQCSTSLEVLIVQPAQSGAAILT